MARVLEWGLPISPRFSSAAAVLLDTTAPFGLAAIALTAHAMADDRQRCLDAGCNDYATKPIDRQEFLAAVARWTARGRTNDALPKPTTSESNANTPMPAAFVYSHLAADPDLGELVEMFVREMPDRINALETQARSRNWQQLARIAHQLKGAAGSYGFDAITPCAARLELAARDAQEEDRILAALWRGLSAGGRPWPALSVPALVMPM